MIILPLSIQKNIRKYPFDLSLLGTTEGWRLTSRIDFQIAIWKVRIPFLTSFLSQSGIRWSTLNGDIDFLEVRALLATWLASSVSRTIEFKCIYPGGDWTFMGVLQPPKAGWQCA